MNIEEYEKMYVLEDTYWWFQGKKHIVFSMLDQCGALRTASGRRPMALDVGCGTGLMLAHLKDYAHPVGLDLSPQAMTYCRRRGISALARSEATRLPVRDGAMDLALALDLLEHIEDDHTAYAEMVRVVRPGGWVFLTVPAHPFLWSDHDKALHHHRRYTYQTFLDLIRAQPMEVHRLSFAITFTFLPIALFRLISRPFRRNRPAATHLILLPQWINRLLIGLLRIEAWVLRRRNLPFGVSLLAALRKPER